MDGLGWVANDECRQVVCDIEEKGRSVCGHGSYFGVLLGDRVGCLAWETKIDLLVE